MIDIVESASKGLEVRCVLVFSFIFLLVCLSDLYVFQFGLYLFVFVCVRVGLCRCVGVSVCQFVCSFVHLFVRSFVCLCCVLARSCIRLIVGSFVHLTLLCIVWDVLNSLCVDLLAWLVLFALLLFDDVFDVCFFKVCWRALCSLFDCSLFWRVVSRVTLDHYTAIHHKASIDFARVVCSQD